MRVIGYVRVGELANGKGKIDVTTRPSADPLKDSYGNALPTVAFAVAFEIPDSAFGAAAKLIAEVHVKDAQPLATVYEVGDDAAP